MNDWNKLRIGDIIWFNYEKKWYKAKTTEKVKYKTEEHWILKDLTLEIEYILKNNEAKYLIIAGEIDSKPNEWKLIKPNTKIGVCVNNCWFKYIAIQKIKKESDKGFIWRCKDYYTDVEITLRKKEVDILLWLDQTPFSNEEQRKYMWMFHPHVAEKWLHEAKSKKNKK